MREVHSPIIHDRHIVKQYFEDMKRNNVFQNAFSVPQDLTIITCRNEGTLSDRIIDSLSGYEDKSILESNLGYLGINDLVVLKDSRLPWRNTFKIEMINNYLAQCTTKYIMYCDAIDVIFIDNPNKALDIFKSFKCKMLFMSSASIDGYDCMEHIYTWASAAHRKRFLNSGVWIGEIEFVKKVFNYALKYIEPHGVTMDKYREYLISKPQNYPIGSQDQDIFRYIEPMFYPELKVDHNNLIAYRS